MSTSSGRTPGLWLSRSTIRWYIASLASVGFPGAQNTWICTRSSLRSIPRNGPYAKASAPCSVIAMKRSPSLMATVSRMAS